MKPQKTLFKRAAEWLHKHAQEAEMVLASRLDTYLQDGPAPEKVELIDIVVATEACTFIAVCSIVPLDLYRTPSVMESGDVMYALPIMDATWISKG